MDKNKEEYIADRKFNRIFKEDIVEDLIVENIENLLDRAYKKQEVKQKTD